MVEFRLFSIGEWVIIVFDVRSKMVWGRCQMNNQVIGKVSQKGQIVIPIAMRKSLGLEKGTEVIFELNDNKLTIQKVPTALDWANLVEILPVENVEMDKEGHYDPEKSPDFQDWMVNG